MLTLEEVSALPVRRASPATGPVVALIPAYNEERFIGSLVLAVLEYADVVVVVDDGSSDRTAWLAERAGATVLRHPVNLGKTAGVNTGFVYVRTLDPQAVVMLDGDGQHSAHDIPAVLKPVLDGTADVVVGSRFLDIHSEIPFYRQVGQHGLTLITNLASGVPVSDSQSGFRAFSLAALDALDFCHAGFSIESEMQFLIGEHRLRVVEAPINVTYAEKAKRNPVRHGMQVVNGVLQLVGQVRPLLFFGLTGIIIFVTGSALGLRTFEIYSRTHTLAIGYGLLAVLSCILGTLFVFAGVLLHSVRAMLQELRKGVIAHRGVRFVEERGDARVTNGVAAPHPPRML